MSLGAESGFGEGKRIEERRNFNDLETSLAGLKKWNAKDTFLILFFFCNLPFHIQPKDPPSC